MKRETLKRKINKNLSPSQKLFADAIDYNALSKALDDPEGKKIIESIIKKIKIF